MSTDDESVSHRNNAVFVAIPLVDDIEAAASVLSGTTKEAHTTTDVAATTSEAVRLSRASRRRWNEKNLDCMLWVLVGAIMVIAFVPFYGDIRRLVQRLLGGNDDIVMLSAGGIRQSRSTTNTMIMVDSVNHRFTEQAYFSTELTEDNFHQFLRDNDNAFVNFCSPHCVWCQRLEPSWEMFAQLMVQQSDMAVGVGRVDCKIHSELCRSENSIMEHPTLRWFHRGVAQTPDYKMDRSVQGLMDFASMKVNEKSTDSDWSTSPEQHQSSEEESRDLRDYPLVGPPRRIVYHQLGDGSDDVGYYHEEYDPQYGNVQPSHSFDYGHALKSDLNAAASEVRHSSDVGREESPETYPLENSQDSINSLDYDDRHALTHKVSNKDDNIEGTDVLQGFVEEES